MLIWQRTTFNILSKQPARSDFCGHYQSYNKFVHALTLSIFSSDEKYK